MTPHEQRLLRSVQATANDIIDGFDREQIPTPTAFAISCQVAITLLERLPHELRHNIAAALIARLTYGQHYDA